MKERIALYAMRALGTLDELRRREDGQALVEYGLIIALIAVICIGALGLIGTNINTKLSSIANNL